MKITDDQGETGKKIWLKTVLILFVCDSVCKEGGKVESSRVFLMILRNWLLT